MLYGVHLAMSGIVLHGVHLAMSEILLYGVHLVMSGIVLYGVHLAMSGIVLYGVHLAMSGISLVNIKNNEYYEKESLNSDGQQFHTLIIPTCIVYDTQGELRGNYTSALIRILIQVNYFLLIYLIFLFFCRIVSDTYFWS